MTQIQFKPIENPLLQGILSDDALDFIEQLHVRFNSTRLELLENRIKKQTEIDKGNFPKFLPETEEIRTSDWKCASTPDDIKDRRVEITGPVDRKMIVNALNSGAKVFMADFEDSNSPSFDNIINGQRNLWDAIRRSIDFTDPKTQKEYKLNPEVATLFVRPRGWHMVEKNITLNGVELSASLVDFGLYFYHNAKDLLSRGTAPYFYLPKMESYLEARLWNDIFVFSQDYVGIPQGTIRATVLIETILASFEMDEILYELRAHSAGLNCGRWDYIFSFIKKFRNYPGFVLPDRSQVTMGVDFMKNYSHLLIKTCHKRGVHAMGGMAAQIPIKNDDNANAIAFEKVRQDKLREVLAGHDGTWVAHPGMVSLAMDVFNEHMPTPNQIEKEQPIEDISADDLLKVPHGTITEEGIRNNISVGIQYIESWLRGNGAAAINHLMEDAATAEISRTQLWQWIRYQAILEDRRTLTPELYQAIRQEEVEKLKLRIGDNFEQSLFPKAIELFDELVLSIHYEEFLTTKAYSIIN